MDDRCPECGELLTDHRKYLYCYRCSKQFKRKVFRKGLKEVTNTLQGDQRKAMKR
ncbi:MAG: hypothetical protein U9R75_12115 [Candidatus Thermoplasmatota archaeon]|nr:hypothetical protein [Candidatus Thermoplasmatota archaeon]